MTGQHPLPVPETHRLRKKKALQRSGCVAQFTSGEVYGCVAKRGLRRKKATSYPLGLGLSEAKLFLARSRLRGGGSKRYFPAGQHENVEGLHTPVLAKHMAAISWLEISL